MKRIYYLILLFALILLFEPITDFIILDQHMDFYAPYLNEEEDSFRVINPPFVGDEKRAEVLLALEELAQKHKLTVAMQSHDLRGTLGRESSGDDLLLVYATGSPERLEKLPFEKTPTLEKFLQEDVLYSSSSDTPAEHRIKAPSTKYTFYLTNFSRYKGSIQSGSFFIMDSTKEQIDAFLGEVQERTGLDFSQERRSLLYQHMSFRGFAFYMERMKASFGGRRLLHIAILGLVMLLYYLRNKKIWSVKRLFGYSLVDVFLSLLVVMIVPSFFIALLSFIPLMLYYGLRLEVFSKLFLAYLPVFGVFLVFQLLVVLVMVFDQSRSSPLATLQEKKKPWVLLSFGFLFKILTLLLIFPILSANLSSMNNLVDYYKDKIESKQLYEDVWILSSQKAPVSLSGIDVEGKMLDPMQEGQQLPWLKAFYDEIRDDYPVFWVESHGHDDPNHVQRDLLHVNGNFVRLMDLKDEKGNALLLNNEDKFLLATKDRAEPLDYFVKTVQGRGALLMQSTKAFDKKFSLPPDEVKTPEVVVLEEGSTVPSYLHVSGGGTYHLYGELDRFSLAVNTRYAPVSLEHLCFVGMTEEEREELLKDVSHLRYTDHLIWKSYLDHIKMMDQVNQFHYRETLWNFGTTLLTMVFLSGFLFYVAYDALSRRWAVLYLFGGRYLYNSILLLAVLLAINLLAYLIGSSLPSAMITKTTMKTVLLIIMASGVLFFGIAQLIYRRKTLKNLTVR